MISSGSLSQQRTFSTDRTDCFDVDMPVGRPKLGLQKRLVPVLPFSKLNKIFFGYFDPEEIFLDNKNK